MKIKVEDNVLVITGKEKGKTGKVSKVLKKKNKIVVEGVNNKVKYVKKGVNGPGKMFKLYSPFDLSNVKLICPGCSKAVRVSYSIPEKGKKYRICKKCNTSLDSVKKTKK